MLTTDNCQVRFVISEAVFKGADLELINKHLPPSRNLWVY